MLYLRLKKNTDFQKLFKRGNRVYSPQITMLWQPSKSNVMGIALSKKHGKAVKRNRIKRIIRAAYSNNLHKLDSAISVVILPKVGEELTFRSVEKSINACIKRINASCQSGLKH